MVTSPIDFAILTVLTEELEALLSLLGEAVSGVAHHPALGEVITVSVTSPKVQRQTKGLILPVPSVGRLDSAITTTMMLQVWRPRYILMVGLAGGFRQQGVQLGDVLISTEIVDFGLQKVTDDGLELRPRRYKVSQYLLQVAIGLAANNTFGYQIDGRPAQACLHFGPIASGDQVIASSDIIRLLLDKEPKLTGVEMEGAGMAAAACRAPEPVEFMIVRGVSDLADESKSDYWRKPACFAAAAFATQFLKIEAETAFR